MKTVPAPTPYDPETLRNLPYRGTTAEQIDRAGGGPALRKVLAAMLAEPLGREDCEATVREYRRSFPFQYADARCRRKDLPKAGE
jgi:hypothetical protein